MNNTNGNFVIAWYNDDSSEIHIKGYNSTGGVFILETAAGTNATNEAPNIAMQNNIMLNDGYFVVSYTKNSSNIYVHRFNSVGSSIESEVQVNTGNIASSAVSDVAMDSNGRFVVTWVGGDGADIYAQCYNADGTTNGINFGVNAYTTNFQTNPAVAINSSGQFVVVWEGEGTGDVSGIFACGFNFDQTLWISEFKVNSFTTNSQQFPAIAMNSTGKFIITWTSVNQDGDSFGIYAQLFNSDGTTYGSEFQVNTTTVGFQYRPAAAMNESGQFIIAWTGGGTNGLVSAQLFNADGTTSGSEFVVNSDTTSYLPYYVTVGLNATEFVATWNYEEGQSYARIFDVESSGPFPCFKEGSKILCLIDGVERYTPIEELRKGTLVKTLLNGYVPIVLLGSSKLYNPPDTKRIKDRLYICHSTVYPDVFEDLVITGCHSILVDNITETQRNETLAILDYVYVTDKKYRLMACVDERAEIYTPSGTFDIYHLALEHPDRHMNYGIYANGLLVETCSQRFLQELSNMTLI